MNVLFATDGSREAQAAGAWLARLPFAKNDDIDVLTVIRDHAPHGVEGPEVVNLASLNRHNRALWESTTDVAQKLVPAFREVQTCLRRGDPVAQILSVARSAAIELIVLGHAERSALAERLLGTVSRGVLERAPCPVLLVPPGSRVPHRVFLAYDSSPAAQAGLQNLLHLPFPEDTAVTVLSIAEEVSPAVPITDPYGGMAYMSPEYVEALQAEEERRKADATECAAEAIRQIEQRGWKASRIVASGKAAEEILAAAKATDADLIVLGAHTRHEWIAEMFLGNTALAVLRRARCAILVGHGKGASDPHREDAGRSSEPTAR